MKYENNTLNPAQHGSFLSHLVAEARCLQLLPGLALHQAPVERVVVAAEDQQLLAIAKTVAVVFAALESVVALMAAMVARRVGVVVVVMVMVKAQQVVPSLHTGVAAIADRFA